MPYLPTTDESYLTRQNIDAFYGYNHKLKLADGEWYDTENLTTAAYPLLAVRGKRGALLNLTDPGGIIEKDCLGYVDNGTLYYNFEPTSITDLTPGEKRLVSFGAYILIFPDNRYYNTEKPDDYGYIDAHHRQEGTLTYEMCHVDGTPYEDSSVYVGDREPSVSQRFEIWIKSYNGTTVTYQYNISTDSWVELNTVYTKISFPTQDIAAKFKQHDAVEISGCSFAGINGSKILYAVGDDYIVVVHQLGAHRVTKDDSISISREMPELDFVFESNNRLWGCFYGWNEAAGATVNEIRCSALGDFKNWNQFLGISTDSWVGSVGSDGEWTGGINYLGSPTFFKENHIHVVGVSTSGAHQISETPCRGVQKGSHGSLRIVNETLYYKSRSDVCAYQGGFPQGVSNNLGDVRYYDAVAGVFGERYFISMRNADGWNQFVYDTSQNLWMREDGFHAAAYAKVDDELYALSENKTLWALNGTAGTLEDSLPWYCESGIMNYDSPDNKYVSRFNFRLKGELGARVECYIMYDSDDNWHYEGTVRCNGINTVTLPIRPRRCDHYRMKLIGRGNVKIFSIARYMESSTDV